MVALKYEADGMVPVAVPVPIRKIFGGFAIDDRKLKRAGLDYWHQLDITYYDGLDDFYAKSAFAHYERESSRRKGWSSTFIPTDYEDAYEEYRKGMPNRSKYGTKADDAKVYDDIPAHDNEKLIVEDFSLVSNERQLIVKALKATDGRRREAAKLLGISERTLFRKINDYDIDIEE